MEESVSVHLLCPVRRIKKGLVRLLEEFHTDPADTLFVVIEACGCLQHGWSRLTADGDASFARPTGELYSSCLPSIKFCPICSTILLASSMVNCGSLPKVS